MVGCENGDVSDEALTILQPLRALRVDISGIKWRRLSVIDLISNYYSFLVEVL
jgi:hypothetical protein